MSDARNELIIEIRNAWVNEGRRWNDADDEAERAVKAYAHELAEQIRAFQITYTDDFSYDRGKDAGLDLAADLIDPEVDNA